MFKLFYPSGKVFMTHNFGDDDFADFFSVEGKKIIFAVDTVIEIAEYCDEDRAYEVYDQIINAYNRKKSFTLPLN